MKTRIPPGSFLKHGNKLSLPSGGRNLAAGKLPETGTIESALHGKDRRHCQ